MLVSLLFLLKLSPILLLSLLFSRQFGGRLKGKHKKEFSNSKNWNGKIFLNLSPTRMNISRKSLPGLIRAMLKDRKQRAPEKPIRITPFDDIAFMAKPEKAKFIWYGHSAVLLQINGKNILIDPMFGPDASPIAPITTKRFSENSLDIIDSFPEIDAVLITHDHYDHLDYKSIKKLRSKVKNWFVAIGAGRHLARWKIEKDRITEFDWWQELHFEGIDIVFTASRHFSGRGPFDRSQSLWGGWILRSATCKIYWSGDGGYGSHFKDIGKKYGPFDWAFIECGQYNEHWHQLHNYPEESVQAAIDVGARVAIPVHWGGFTLALHTWKDPIDRFVTAANDNGQKIATPQIGELVQMGEENSVDWWSQLN